MKRMTLLVSVILACCSGVFADLTLNWYDLSFKLYDHDGTEVSASASWTFQLIADADNNTSVSGMIAANQWQIGAGALNNASDDAIAGTASTWSSANQLVEGWNTGATTDIPDTYSSDRFYFRFFNSDSTYAGIIYKSNNTWVLPVDNSSSVSDANLTVGTANVAGTQVIGFTDGWGATIPVPEPQTWGLMVMGLGIIMIAARKKFVK